MNFEGELPAKTPENPNEKIPAFIEIIDKGKANVIEDTDSFVHMDLKGKKLKGLYHFKREAPDSKVWVFAKSKKPGQERRMSELEADIEPEVIFLDIGEHPSPGVEFSTSDMNKIKLPLIIRGCNILKEGTHNGIFYPAEVLKETHKGLLEPPKTPEERNRTSLVQDHADGIRTWVGDFRNIRWNEKEKAIQADLWIADQDIARKIVFQQERGFSSWGLSPHLHIKADGKIAREVKFRNTSLVLDPAQGMKTMLPDKKKGVK